MAHARRRPYDPLDYHDPTAGIGGAPPARSALGLRMLLAGFGFFTCVGFTIAFIWIGEPAVAAVTAALAASAAIDAYVVNRRHRIERDAESRQPADGRDNNGC